MVSFQEMNPATGQPNNTAVVFLNELGNMVDFFFAGQLSGSLRRSGQGAGAVFTDPAKVRPCMLQGRNQQRQINITTFFYLFVT